MPFASYRLTDADSAAGVGEPVVGRFLLLTIIVVVMLLLSALWTPAGIWPAAVVILVTILVAPAYGLALCTFLAPFQGIAGLEPTQFHLLHGLVWSATAVRLAIMARPGDFRYVMRSPTSIFVLLFAFLVVFHNALPFNSPYYWLGVGFACSLAVIVAVVTVPGLLPPYLPRLIVAAIFASVLLTICFDFAYVYAPLPSLRPFDSLELPPNFLRLAGLHANPLASGKFILVLGCALAAALITDQEQPRVSTTAIWLLFAIVAFALVATESKSTILAFGISLALMTIAVLSRVAFAARSLTPVVIMGLMFVSAIVLWSVVLAPPIKCRAATAWLNLSFVTQRADLNELAGLPRNVRPQKTGVSFCPLANRVGVLDKFASEFRIGKSFRVQGFSEDLDNPLSSLHGKPTGVARDCGVFCTGQRDLLWKAGFEVVQNHWLTGIGFGGWKRVLDEKLGFPFDHPHLGLLEVWGEFGIVGLLMYLTFGGFLIARAGNVIGARVYGFEKWFLISGSMVALAFLTNELFDTTKFFSMSPHAIWIWLLLALQEHYLRQPVTWSTPQRFVEQLWNKFKYSRSTTPALRGGP